MGPTINSANVPPGARPARHSRMALAAVLLSIVAFIPPFGIAAIILGHFAGRRVAASQGRLNGKATARAAVIIAYLQMFLLTIAVLLAWQVLHLTVADFRRDPLVQRVFRESDARQTLDYTSAREEEITARTLVIQMVAIEDQHRRQQGQGYLCSINQLTQAGVEGSTPAEKSAFRERLAQSAYIYEITACHADEDDPATTYKLTAVPRAPRMPQGSLLFCADQTGAVKQLLGGISDDCFTHGYVDLQPGEPAVPPQQSSAQSPPSP
jgi:hypothetical protein